MEENTQFKILNLFEKQERPKSFSKITMLPLYRTSRHNNKNIMI